MNNILRLNERELVKLVKTIVEQLDLDSYDDQDFLDVFFIKFKEWIYSKLGDEYKKFPFSYLLRKYGMKFKSEIFQASDEDDDYDEVNPMGTYEMERIGRKIVERELYALPSLHKQEKFTEKFAKVLKNLKEYLELPDYVDIEFTEEKPQHVSAKVIYDFPKMVHSQSENSYSRRRIENDLKTFLNNYLGVDFGRASHGELVLDFENNEYRGMEEWVKNILNKKIKKEIKQLPNATKHIHRIQITVDSDRAELKIIFKEDWYNRAEQRKVSELVDEYIKSLGLGPHFKVSRN